MLRKIITYLGYFFIGLILLGQFGAILYAALSGQVFYGKNYQGLPLGTYSSLLVFAILIGVVIYQAIRWVYKKYKK